MRWSQSPGLPPTTAHLSELLAQLAKESRTRPSCARRTTIRARASGLLVAPKIPAVMLPFTVGGSDKAQDLFALFDGRTKQKGPELCRCRPR